LKILDFHTHCFSDAVAERAMAVLTENAQYPPHFDGTLSGLLASMERAGISHAVVLNIATNPRQNTAVNNWAIELAKVPNITAFGSIHPDFADYKAEITRIKAAGIRGVKFHPDYMGFFADDPKAYPIYEECAAAGLIMLFHCGQDLVPRDPPKCTPDRFAKLVRDLRGAKLVGAHLGGQMMWDDVFEHLLGKDVYLDTSFGFKYMTAPQIKRVLDTHDSTKILFGTDTPWQDQSIEVEEMSGYVKNKRLYEMIIWQNGARLLNLK